jgi:hypothetical protein
MIEFYATVSYGRLHKDMPRCCDGREIAYLLPASSWSRGNLSKPKLPAEITHTAADCGGYVATKIWGDYRYSPQQYVDWLETFTPRWAATMDYCCEKEVAANKGIVRERQQRTTDMAYLFWQDYRDAAWAWVPTIQGWQVDDYVRHAQELKPLIIEMKSHYGPSSAFRVGIGTLCKRASVSMVHEVVNAVARELPGVPLHLWGIKLTALKSKTVLMNVVSVDSAAFDPGGLPGSKWAWEEQRASGMSQRKFLFCVRLPQYLRKVNAALSEPKSLPLF